MIFSAALASAITAACLSTTTKSLADAQVRPDAVMLRFPDVSKDEIVFRYAGDLWLVDKKGGTARLLSSPAGNESFPKFSPDGKSIACVAGYDGGSDVYVLGVEGGIPRRVTHHPTGEVLCGWDPSGKDLIFFSSQVSGQARAPKLFRVSAQGGQPVPLPVPYGTFGTIDDTETWLAYTPVTQSEFRTWKRYQGGLAQDVWLYNLKTNASQRVTDWAGTDCLPMWHGKELYFLSDRGKNGRLNLWVYDTASSKTSQVTDFADFDVRFPSVGPDDIVFENGGKLYRWEFAAKKSVPVDVVIPSDRPNLRERSVDVTALAGNVTPGPTGKRALLEARGEIFSLPAKDGVNENVTRTGGVAERFPAWSPDGKWIAYISDRSGENELWVRGADGKPFTWPGDSAAATEKQLTNLGPGYKFAPRWSPDTKSIVFCTNDGALHLVALDGLAHSVLDTNPDGQPFAVDWSPDSRWLVYSMRGKDTRQPGIVLYDLKDKSRHAVTSGMFADGDPAFDRNGEWLYFASSRNLQPIYSDFDNTWVYTNSTKLLAVPLRADVKNPWAPENDEEKVASADTEGEKKDGEKKDDEKKDDEKKDEGKPGADGAKGGDAKKEVKPVEIALDGFEARAILVDAPAGRIANLQGGEGKVLYLRLPRAGTGQERDPDADEPETPASALVFYDLKDKKEAKILDGVTDFRVTADGKKVLVHTDAWAFVELAKDQTVKDKIPLAKLTTEVDPREEWNQILTDAGRVMRDYFYVPEMHGVDWTATVARYKAALADCTSRDDVDYLIREMIAELNIGHAYDSPPPSGMESAGPAQPVGLLGCDWTLDQGAYKIAHILGGGAYDADARSPLAVPGVDVKEGDWLLAVNGSPVDATQDVYAAFVGCAGKATWITVNSAPTADGKERRVLVEPLANEGELRYRSWVARNRELVDKLSNGRIGYVHVPDTGVHGQTELLRQFMGQYQKDALLIDERWNSGGQIPDRFIELLNRPVLNYWAVRHGEDWAWPQVGHRGPKCMLINGSSGSGGDCFPWYFRQAKLGPLIGMRTWGGLVGISGNPGFVDGSSITVPTFGFYETDGTWAVEGFGVAPDIEVVDDPAKMVHGEDPQLLAGVDNLLQQLKTWKFDHTKRPQAPNRSGSGIRPEDQ